MSSLRADKLLFRYAESPVLQSVSFSLEAGEMVGLIGPNGAGKTTLLRLMAGLLSAESGRVKWGERSLTDIAEGERSRLLAYLAQGAPAHWPLSVERVVELGRIPHRAWWQGLGEADRQAVDEAIVRADVHHLRERLVTTLSGGERTRVMLARLFATGPEMILADEPVASLDPYHQLRVMQTLRDHSRGGGGVLVVLHDLNLAARFCDRLLLLDAGRAICDGPPRQVLENPALARAYGVAVEVAEQGGELWVRYRRAISDSGDE